MPPAVLFIIFNRPDTTVRVFNAIRQAKPQRLYIASDGPRTGKQGEAEKVQQLRDMVFSGIDWPCQIKTLLRKNNLGCKMAVSGAINWFFEHEEQGIILEDDCLPHPSFFTYCEELLARYADDKRVWHIGANNYQDGKWRGDGDYYFSNNMHIWGWATWKNRWQHYDIHMQELDQFLADKRLEKIFTKPGNRNMWRRQFKWIVNGLDTWDIQWQYTIWKHGGLSIAPNVNLVTNIGFGRDATHTPDKDSPLANREIQTLIIQTHPDKVKPNLEADEYEFIAYRKKPSLRKRVEYKLSKIVKMFAR